MYTLAQPKKILKCKKCKVTFVPESQTQTICHNCEVLQEIKMKIKARK
jgi:hypothetical protein